MNSRRASGVASAAITASRCRPPPGALPASAGETCCCIIVLLGSRNSSTFTSGRRQKEIRDHGDLALVDVDAAADVGVTPDQVLIVPAPRALVPHALGS